MKPLSILTAFLAFSVTPILVASGEPPDASKDRAITRDSAIRIKHDGSVVNKDARQGDLCILNGDIMFVAFLVDRQRPGGPDDPPLPDYSLHFLWEGLMLRVKMAPRNTVVDRQGHFPKEFLAKDGWYVTADFTTDPPRVILTEQPTEHSRWKRVLTPKDKGYPSRWFIKNEGATGKAVWLSMEKDGKTYRGGIARKPILSAEQMDYFWIGDAQSGK